MRIAPLTSGTLATNFTLIVPSLYDTVPRKAALACLLDVSPRLIVYWIQAQLASLLEP
jgi:hypothetical protein